ncbi:MAG: hypothetical protein R2827_00830 [Bdellovibrionales bacterium]
MNLMKPFYVLMSFLIFTTASTAEIVYWEGRDLPNEVTNSAEPSSAHRGIASSTNDETEVRTTLNDVSKLNSNQFIVGPGTTPSHVKNFDLPSRTIEAYDAVADSWLGGSAGGSSNSSDSAQ